MEDIKRKARGHSLLQIPIDFFPVLKEHKSMNRIIKSSKFVVNFREIRLMSSALVTLQ